MREVREVVADWRAAVARYTVWWRFGVLDIRLRYRRTLLGPFWVTLSFGVSAVALSFVYSFLFNVAAGRYSAYLIVGLAVWGLIAALITEGCTTFVRYSQLIQQHPLPLLVHPLRSVVAAFLTFAHNLVVVVIAVVVTGVGVGWPTLFAIPALALLLINGVWVALLLGMLCARFRDLPQVVTVLINIAFLVTPVFWYRQMLGARGRLVDLNPLYAFLDIVRSPLLGELPSAVSLHVVLVATIGGWLVTLIVATRLQSRLTYWL